MNDSTQRRLARRLRHRSRSAWAVTVAIAVALVAAYVGIEAALAAIGVGPLLATPQTLVEGALSAPDAWGLALGIVAVILGIALLVLALAPGRIGRHIVAASGPAAAAEGTLVLADDSVIAGAVSRAAAREVGLQRANVSTAVGGRSARIDLRPAPGFPVDADKARAAGERVVTEAGVSPTLTIRAHTPAEPARRAEPVGTNETEVTA
ncbi:hypothetical protein [uncultured Microbacterium sp.]|uniref:hypothetical protein n=1 Tax=uncultured Microbacterium sp. TaxID=191216 RepID=UPI0025D93128|nr:hypothetical protein [uncultured Microbacterium sp.]